MSPHTLINKYREAGLPLTPEMHDFECKYRRRRRGSNPKRPCNYAARAPLMPDLVELINRICEQFAISADTFAGRGRHRSVVRARCVCVAAARMAWRYSYPQIARAMGRPNHSTVISMHHRGLEDQTILEDARRLAVECGVKGNR